MVAAPLPDTEDCCADTAPVCDELPESGNCAAFEICPAPEPGACICASAGVTPPTRRKMRKPCLMRSRPGATLNTYIDVPYCVHTCIYLKRDMASTSAGKAPNKHQQRSEESYRKLIAAGLRIFARDGFEASRIEDIAAEAGHTRGAFYANFDTKEDLFFALLEQQAEKRVRSLQAALEGIETREEALQAVRAHYQSCAMNRQWVLLTLEFKLF